MSTDRRSRSTVAAVLALALTGAAATTASATTHDYCNWDGSNCANSANVVYFAQGDALLTNNRATLVFGPAQPTIFCGAHLNGAQYAGYTSGNPTCNHSYSGANVLKADEYVSIAATTHGTITY